MTAQISSIEQDLQRLWKKLGESSESFLVSKRIASLDEAVNSLKLNIRMIGMGELDEVPWRTANSTDEWQPKDEIAHLARMRWDQAIAIMAEGAQRSSV